MIVQIALARYLCRGNGLVPLLMAGALLALGTGLPRR